MARPKKNSRGAKKGVRPGRAKRPAFPLSIDQARIFALAAEADAAESQEAKSEAAVAPAPASLAQVLQEELQRIRAAPNVEPQAPGAGLFSALIREELALALPGILREALREATPAATAASEGDSERARAWIAEQLQSLEGGLAAVEPLGCLNDNRLLADQLFVQAATAGLLFGVQPAAFFEMLALEVRRFLRRIANQGVTPAAVDPNQNTQPLQDTAPETPPRPPARPPLELRATRLPLTPLMAHRYPQEILEIEKILESLERTSPVVAPLFRLRMYAGRTDAEIAEFTRGSSVDTANYLRDFVHHLVDDVAAAGVLAGNET